MEVLILALQRCKLRRELRQAGDNNSARTHLDAVRHALEGTVTLPTAGASTNATKHFDEGMDALQTGDTNGVIIQFTAADQALRLRNNLNMRYISPHVLPSSAPLAILGFML